MILHNTHALEGLDRCQCGCKYWEYDRCIDCGTHVHQAVQLDYRDAKEAYERATVTELSAAQDELRRARNRLIQLDKQLLKG